LADEIALTQTSSVHHDLNLYKTALGDNCCSIKLQTIRFWAI